MKRNQCYCGKIPKERLKKEGIPEGFCGLCEICNKPGHTQHFPGAVPYTGTWCDVCLKKIARRQRIKEICIPGIIIIFISIILFKISQL